MKSVSFDQLTGRLSDHCGHCRAVQVLPNLRRLIIVTCIAPCRQLHVSAISSRRLNGGKRLITAKLFLSRSSVAPWKVRGQLLTEMPQLKSQLIQIGCVVRATSHLEPYVHRVNAMDRLDRSSPVRKTAAYFLIFLSFQWNVGRGGPTVAALAVGFLGFVWMASLVYFEFGGPKASVAIGRSDWLAHTGRLLQCAVKCAPGIRLMAFICAS